MRMSGLDAGSIRSILPGCFLYAALLFLQPLNAVCDFPGYTHTGVKTLEIVTQASQQIASGTQVIRFTPSNSGIAAGEKHFWKRCRIDVQQGRSVTVIHEGKSKPDWTRTPLKTIYLDSAHLHHTIDYTRKRVLINEISSAQWDGSNILFAGRIHAGHSLAALIGKASDENKITIDGESRTVRIGTPYFNPPAYPQPLTFHLDERHRVIKIVEPSRLFTFEWSATHPEGYEYVSHSLLETQGNKIQLRLEEWVREFKIDPAFPENAFHVTYPESYSAFDTRKLMRPPVLK